MSAEARRTPAVLAARRAVLIAQCARQRAEAATDFNALVEPIHPGGLRQYFGANLKLPLTIAGVVLGMIATKPARALPVLTAGLSLWKLASTVLSILRRPKSE
jgi:hypothetical protein